MKQTASFGVQRFLGVAFLTTLLMLSAGPRALAAGVSNAELRGYKGGLVELGLKNGTTVRAVLYGYDATHLELEAGSGRTVMLHRSWIQSLKAAPAGSTKSPRSAFPANASGAYAAAPPPARDTTPPPRETPPETPGAKTPPAAGTPAKPGAAPTKQKIVDGMIERGLVFQLRMGGNLLTFVGNGFASWLNSSFLVGYKMGRLTIGVGLEMSYSDDDLPNADPDPVKTSAALVLFQPTVEYYLAIKSPLALYLTAGLHLGFVNAHADPGKDFTDPLIGFHAGLGMRYFFHPRFALGVEGGLRGVWMMIENDEDVNTDDNNTGVMSLYGAATLTAIW